MKTLIGPAGRIYAALLLAFTARPATAQQLGYKLLGSVGIDAGVQPPPGLTVIDQTLHYGAKELRDRQGNVVAIDGLSLSATGTALGASYTTKPKRAPYLSFAIGVPVASVHVNSNEPAASLNGYGFGDVFLQPVKVGWRERRFDVVAGYVAYAPTGRFEPKSSAGPGRGYWTHQISVGGALYADSSRTYRMTALASYDQNTRKQGIDVRRGNMFQIQGGAGANVRKILTVGVAGYALWQVTADRGTEIPPALRDEDSRVFGLGPEVNVTIPRWQTRATFRVERELGVRSRPRGQVIAFGLYWRALPTR